jgi:hypothetical protein
MEKLYENYVSHSMLMLVFVCMDLNLYEKYEFLNLSHIIKFKLNWQQNSNKSIQNKIYQTKLNTKFKQN